MVVPSKIHGMWVFNSQKGTREGSPYGIVMPSEMVVVPNRVITIISNLPIHTGVSRPPLTGSDRFLR